MRLFSSATTFNDDYWSLKDLLGLITYIQATCHPPYTIVLYSLFSMHTVQQALKKREHESKRPVKLYVTQLLIVKVRLSWFAACQTNCANNRIIICLYGLTIHIRFCCRQPVDSKFLVITLFGFQSFLLPQQPVDARALFSHCFSQSLSFATQDTTQEGRSGPDTLFISPEMVPISTI